MFEESNVNHPTELQSREEVDPRFLPPEVPAQDRDLMPPPPVAVTKHQQTSLKKGPETLSDEELPRKKLKGALVGIASVYGSDDSNDSEDDIS